MDAEYIKENCCNVLGCRDEFIKQLQYERNARQLAEQTLGKLSERVSNCDLQNQLESLSEKVLTNQTSFTIHFLTDCSHVVTELKSFYMNESECLIIFSTRMGINQTFTISSDKLIQWSKSL